MADPSPDWSDLKYYSEDGDVSTIYFSLTSRCLSEGTVSYYETMVFKGPLDQEQVRYETAEEAAIGHELMVVRVKAVAVAAKRCSLPMDASTDTPADERSLPIDASTDASAYSAMKLGRAFCFEFEEEKKK